MKVLPEKAREHLEKMLRIGNKAIEAAFAKVGHKGEKTQASAAQFEKHVSEIEARDKCSKADAMAKARKEFPEDFKVYQGSQN